MKKIASISKKLQFLGLLGLPIFFSDLLIWKLLWLFWLFALVPFVYEFKIYYQSFRQLFGLPYTFIRYKFKLPDVHTYEPSMTYSLPFNGEWIVVNGSVLKPMSHSWNITSQRYAYDFVQLDPSSSTHHGDPMVLDNYYCYGKEVTAPADGIIVSAIDRYPDSPIDKKGRAVCSANDIRGNHLIIKHSDNEYSLLAHLKPGSLIVHAGQSVKRGDSLAQCGNSGNTSEPHLHFQLQSSPNFYTAAGLPLSFGLIDAKPLSHYNHYDPRPTLNDPLYKTNGNICYIHRGMAVSNQLHHAPNKA